MSEFLHALSRSDLLQHALIAGIICSVACGIVGSYVVARRITYIAGGIAHAILGGMGAAYYLNKVHGWGWLQPLHGGVVVAVVAAMIIGWVSLRAKQREDTVISAIWAVGMAAGVLFISQTPGYSEDLMNYLFGNILVVSHRDLWLIAGLDVLVVLIGVAFYRQLLAVCYDEEFARLRGVQTEFYYLLLLCLAALTVVVLTTVVGLVMVIALLTLPVAIAGHLVNRLWQIMLVSAVLSAGLTTGGLAISYSPELPSGAVTIALAGGLYLLVVIARRMVPTMGQRA